MLVIRVLAIGVDLQFLLLLIEADFSNQAPRGHQDLHLLTDSKI